MPFNPSDVLSQLGFGIPMLNQLDQPTPPGYVTPGTLQGGGIQQGFPVSAGPGQENLADILGLAKPAPNQVLQAPVMGSKRVAGGGGPPQMGGAMFTPSSTEGEGFPPGTPVWKRIAFAFASPEVQKAVSANFKLQRKTDEGREANMVRDAVSKALRIGDTDKAEQVLRDLGQRVRYMETYGAVSKELYVDINRRRIANAKADQFLYEADQVLVDHDATAKDPYGRIIYLEKADPRGVALHRGLTEQRRKLKNGEPSEYGLAFIDITGEEMTALKNSLGQRHYVHGEGPIRIVDTGEGTATEVAGAYPPRDIKPEQKPPATPPRPLQPLAAPGAPGQPPVTSTQQIPQTPLPPGEAVTQGQPGAPPVTPTQETRVPLSQQEIQAAPPTPPPVAQPPTAQAKPQEIPPSRPREKGSTAPTFFETPASTGLAEPERFIYNRLRTRDGQIPTGAIIANYRNSTNPDLKAEGTALQADAQNLRADWQSVVDMFHNDAELARTMAIGANIHTPRQYWDLTPEQKVEALRKADLYYAEKRSLQEYKIAHDQFVGQLRRDYDRVLNPLHDLNTVLRASKPEDLDDRLRGMLTSMGFGFRVLGVPSSMQIGPEAEVLAEGVFAQRTDAQRYLQIQRERIRQAMSQLSPNQSRDTQVLNLLMDDSKWANTTQARQTAAILNNILEEERFEISGKTFGQPREQRLVPVPEPPPPAPTPSPAPGGQQQPGGQQGGQQGGPGPFQDFQGTIDEFKRTHPHLFPSTPPPVPGQPAPTQPTPAPTPAPQRQSTRRLPQLSRQPGIQESKPVQQSYKRGVPFFRFRQRAEYLRQQRQQPQWHPVDNPWGEKQVQPQDVDIMPEQIAPTIPGIQPYFENP